MRAKLVEVLPRNNLSSLVEIRPVVTEMLFYYFINICFLLLHAVDHIKHKLNQSYLHRRISSKSSITRTLTTE